MSDDGNELIRLLDPESAKAVQEVARASTALINAGAAAGSYVDRVSNRIPDNSLGLLGDWLLHVRLRNWDRLSRRTAEILRNRNVKQPMPDAAPASLRPIVDAALNETDDELREIWARLLAAAIDPARRQTSRKSFVSAVKEMDPIDARVFQTIGASSQLLAPGQLAPALSLSRDDLFVSLQSLHRIGCLAQPPETGLAIGLSSFGLLLFRALQD